MIPIVNGLEDEFQGQVDVHQLNAAEEANAQLQSQLGLLGHPTFAILDGEDQLVQQFFGPQTADTLRQAMTSVKGQ